MKSLKAIITSISLFVLLTCSVLADSKKPLETEGVLVELPYPTWFGDSEAISMTQYAFRYTQFIRFRLNKSEKKQHERCQLCSQRRDAELDANKRWTVVVSGLEEMEAFRHPRATPLEFGSKMTLPFRLSARTLGQ